MLSGGRSRNNALTFQYGVQYGFSHAITPKYCTTEINFAHLQHKIIFLALKKLISIITNYYAQICLVSTKTKMKLFANQLSIITNYCAKNMFRVNKNKSGAIRTPNNSNIEPSISHDVLS